MFEEQNFRGKQIGKIRKKILDRYKDFITSKVARSPCIYKSLKKKDKIEEDTRKKSIFSLVNGVTAISGFRYIYEDTNKEYKQQSVQYFIEHYFQRK